MGVVHHAVWPIWYEAARIDWLDKAGFPFALSQKEHVNPAMVDLHMEYKQALSYPETVTISVKPEMLAPKKLALAYELHRSDGLLAGVAHSFHIWTGPDNRAYDLEKGLPEVYSRLQASVESSADEAYPVK